MLRRVVKRAIKGRRGDRKVPESTPPVLPKDLDSANVQKEADLKSEPVPPEPAAPEQPPLEAIVEAPPTPPPSTVEAEDGIAARIAAGDLNQAMPSVSATSGAHAFEDVEINTAEDGEMFWGPIDNESARSKAREEELIIDQWECIACGVCVENTDAVFALPDDAKAVVIQQDGDMALIQDALDSCPVTCIHWTDDPSQYEQTNDIEGNPI